MDSKPFFEVDLLAVDDMAITELKKFSRQTFEIQAILANASDLKYTREIKKIFGQEINQPSEELVRFFTARVYSGRLSQSIRDQFGERTKKALLQFISDRVSDRLKSALAHEEEAKIPPPQIGEPAEPTQAEPTQQVRSGYYIVQAILTQIVDPRRVVMRDQKSYCSVLLDDSNRKQICRLWFNGSHKYVGIFDATKTETRMPIEDLADIYRLSEQLKETVSRYETKLEREPKTSVVPPQ